MSTTPLSIEDFAQRIKDKHPEYAQMDNYDLASRVLKKYPEYTQSVTQSGSPMPAPPQVDTSPVAGGFMPGNIASNAWEGAKGAVGGLYGLGKDLVQNPNWLMGPDSTYEKFVGRPADLMRAKQQQALQEGQGQGWNSRAAGYGLASAVPMVGPWAASLGEQAGSGDVGGAAGQAAGAYGAGKAMAAVPKVAGAAVDMLPSIKRGSAAFQHLDSGLADVTPVTEPKFNIDRVSNSARKVSDRFSATDLKSAPPLVQKLLDRASDTAQPMTWPELRTFKTDLNTLIWDREIPSQFKGPLKNLATDIDTTLRQGADARGQGEVFSKANTDFRRSFKMQNVAEKAGPYAGAAVGAGLGAGVGEAVGHPWIGGLAGKVAGYKAGGPLAGSLVRSITEREVPPQEFPEISPSKVRTTQPKSSQLASVRSVSGGSTPQPTGVTGAEPEIEAIRRGAGEAEPQQAKAAQIQQAKRFTSAGTAEQPTPDIWQQAKGRFEESEAKRAQSQDPEARKEAREKKSGEKIASANLSQLTKDMQSLGYDKATALARAKAALQQHPNDYKAATDAAIRGK